MLCQRTFRSVFHAVSLHISTPQFNLGCMGPLRKKFTNVPLLTRKQQYPLLSLKSPSKLLDCVWNAMAHAQKPDFVFRRNGTSPFKSAGERQFSRLLAAEVCASAVVMLDTTYSEVVWRVLATHCTRQFPLHFPSLALPCAFTFHLESTLESC